MKHFTFSPDAEKAAQQFSEAQGINFNMVPNCIGANTKFWIKLVELNPENISRVPDNILELEEFAKNVDHQLFYRYLPKKYLTAEDYHSYMANPKKAIASGRHPVKISRSNEYSWYCTNDTNDWVEESSLTNDRLLSLIQAHRGADQINRELWTQEFADYLWESPKAIVAFDDIPEEYVRDEWKKLMDVFVQKRYPVFGLQRSSESYEKLPQYWGSFTNTQDMLLALDCEDLAERCENPFGYTIHIDLNAIMKPKDFSKTSEELWNAIKDVAADNPEILRRMFELYGMILTKCMPKELFNLEWLLKSSSFEFYLDDYKIALSELNSATCEVEKLEAEKLVDDNIKSIHRLIKRFVSLDDSEIDVLISTLV